MTITITDSSRQSQFGTNALSFTDHIYLRQVLTQPLNVTVKAYTVYGAQTQVALAAPYSTCKLSGHTHVISQYAGSDELDVRFDYFIPGVQYNSVYVNMSRSTKITLNTPSTLWQVTATIYNGVDDLTTSVPVSQVHCQNRISLCRTGEHYVLCTGWHQRQLHISIQWSDT